MSELHFDKSAASASPEQPSQPLPISSSQDISQLIAEINNIVEAAESRQSAVMLDIQKRIDQITAQTSASATEIPNEFRDAFKQVEQLMEQLAHRIALIIRSPERKTGLVIPAQKNDRYQNNGRLQDVVFTRQQDALKTLSEAFVQEENGSRQGKIPANEQLGKEDDSGKQTASETIANTSTLAKEELVYDQDNPWNEAAAEQLTQLYENGKAGLPVFVSECILESDLVKQTKILSEPSTDVDDWLREKLTNIEATLVQNKRQMSEEDRTWIGDELSSLTAKVQAGISEIEQPEQAVEAIQERFNQFEDRVCEAFEKLDNHQISTGLKEIEVSIVDFSAHVEKIQAEIARIEGIEKDIQLLSDRLSKENIHAMAVQLQSPQNDLDADQIAKLVAHHVTERSAQEITELLPAKKESDHETTEALASLRSLVDSLIIEQRSKGKQHTDRLEAMQQNMLHMLERFEKFEATQNQSLQETDINSCASQTSDKENDAESSLSKKPQVAKQQGDCDAEVLTQDTLRATTDYSLFMTNTYQAAIQSNGSLQIPPQIDDLTQVGANEDEEFSIEAPSSYSEKVSPTKSHFHRLYIVIAVVVATAAGIGSSIMMLDWPVNYNQISAAISRSVAPNDEPRNAEAGPGQLKTKMATSTEPVVRQDITENLLDRTLLPSGIALTTSKPNNAQAQLGKIVQAQKIPALPSQDERSQSPSPALTAALIPSQPQQLKTSGKKSFKRNLPPALIGPLSLRIAAADGDPSASFEVGDRFAEGKGVQQNFAEALKWYTRSATKGFPLAQYRLATLYERGMGTKVDLARAKVWYERAARQGNVKSMHNLAVLLASGKAGGTDYGAAAQWFTEAADRGLADSKFNLAILYENGLGVSKDLSEAYKWFSLASLYGDRDADQRRRGLIAKLNKRALADADAAIKKWRSRAVSRISNDPFFARREWKKQAEKQKPS